MALNTSYYREELNYLRQYAKLLARENPQLASFLAHKEADPDMERLMEGFAFLSGRLREKIEDEYPEVTIPLLNRLQPNFLRPVPAMTIIEYMPDIRRLTSPVKITRNEQVMNAPQGDSQDASLPGEECGATVRRPVFSRSAVISGCFRCISATFSSTARPHTA